MKCRYCTAENKEDAKFCRVCGKQLVEDVICPTCGESTPAGKFCNFCGSPLVRKKRCTKCGTIFEGDRCPVCFGDQSQSPEPDTSIAFGVQAVRKKRCTRCGTIFEGDRCPVCFGEQSQSPEPDTPVAFGAQSVRKKRCTKCGTIFVGERCPVCFGAQSSERSAGTRSVAYPPAQGRNEGGASPSGAGSYQFAGFTSDAKVSAEAENAVESIYRGKRRTYVCFAVIGLITVLFAFAFSFLLGWKATGEVGDESSSVSYLLYYFFHDAYEFAELQCETTYAVMGTAICAVMILTMTAMTVVCVIRFVKCLRSEEPRTFIKGVVLTYLLYIAFSLMLKSLISVSSEYVIVAGNEKFEITSRTAFNWQTYTGLIAGGVLAAVFYIGSSVLAYQKKPKFSVVKRYVLPIVAVVLILASVVFLCEITIGFRSEYGIEGLSYGLSVGESYMQYVIELDDQVVFTYGAMAQVFTFIYAVFAMLVVSKLATHVYNPKENNRFIFEYIFYVAFGVATAVFAFLMAEYMINEGLVDFGEDTKLYLVNLYVGVSGLVAGLVLCLVHLLTKPQVESRPRQRINFVNTASR